ncbi:hypothetical protein HPB50_014234 [Hyalomma asiaticum]|uniref:Uncharacterized protein n=1 Tax=Hyalomma asiaticum TaxID=266040 RepID=A0ACB7TP53_HYAAI|nr:hypothetical protein HPB50_014234 [Hyalomma asiaticum]
MRTTISSPARTRRPGRTVTPAAVPGARSCSLFDVTDRVTKIRYLVNTGPEICVLPPTLTERHHSPVHSPPLTTVNGLTIRTYGQTSMALDICLYKPHFPLDLCNRRRIRQRIVRTDIL